MFKRRFEPQDKRFVELVFCVYKHASDKNVSLGLIKQSDGLYSLPTIELKQNENLEDLVDSFMLSYVSSNWNIPMVPIMKRISGCFTSEGNPNISIVYRVDSPQAYMEKKGLHWMGVTSIFDAIEQDKFATEKEKRIVTETIYTK